MDFNLAFVVYLKAKYNSVKGWLKAAYSTPEGKAALIALASVAALAGGILL